ncbi:MAG: NmrA family NAD(P)-binding protein [Novosphingobium sp.]|jgi:uncharacterized protein YbjT (DUF2867 family)|nr:NmrA family NAD(P)-binding protein [Novosphingobium sp.]
MTIENVLVLGATGIQGFLQLGELRKSGYVPVAASRQKEPFRGSEFEDVEVRYLDYDDERSMAAALDGIDAVLFQAPAMGDIGRLIRYGASVAKAVQDSAVQLVVVNCSMWSPDDTCGDPHYDGIRAMEREFEKGGFPLIILRPTLFMNNLLGDWIRPILWEEGAFRYNHSADMEANWICLEDMARLMVACLGRADLIGGRFHVGGPQRLRTDATIEILSDVLGKPIRHEYLTPIEFGEHYCDLHGQVSDLERETFVQYFASFHTFNNDSPERPFQCDFESVSKTFPEVEFTDMRTWAQAQDWSVNRA